MDRARRTRLPFRSSGRAARFRQIPDEPYFVPYWLELVAARLPEKLAALSQPMLNLSLCLSRKRLLSFQKGL
jgi:hypothetical protein